MLNESFSSTKDRTSHFLIDTISLANPMLVQLPANIKRLGGIALNKFNVIIPSPATISGMVQYIKIGSPQINGVYDENALVDGRMMYVYPKTQLTIGGNSYIVYNYEASFLEEAYQIGSMMNTLTIYFFDQNNNLLLFQNPYNVNLQVFHDQ